MIVNKGTIVLMKFPQSALAGNKVQPEDWFPCMVTSFTDETISVKVFHPEQVVQKNDIPRRVSVITTGVVDGQTVQTTKLSDNPEIRLPDISAASEGFLVLYEGLHARISAIEAALNEPSKPKEPAKK